MVNRNRIRFPGIFFCFIALAGICSCAAAEKRSQNSSLPPAVAEQSSGDADGGSYTLGPGDAFSINVLYHEDLNRTVNVTPNGYIFLPLAGRIKAEGLTAGELKSVIAEKLAAYIVDPQIDINVDTVTNLQVYVLGEINSPGVVAYAGKITVYEAISQAGGFTNDADKKHIFCVDLSGSRIKLTTVNYEDLFDTGKITPSHYLKKDDIIYVKPKSIATLEIFMRRVNTIISPFTNAARGIVLGADVSDVFSGDYIKY